MCHLVIKSCLDRSMATLLKPAAAAALSTESPPFNPRLAGSIGNNGISGAMGGGSASAGAQPDNSNSNAIAKHTFSYNGYVMTIELLTLKPSCVVTSEGCLLVFAVVFGVTSSSRPALAPFVSSFLTAHALIHVPSPH